MRGSTAVRKASAGQGPRPEPGEDPRAIALFLIVRLGEQAPSHATYQALKARQRGDQSAMDAWLWIAGAAREILRIDPVCEG
ncbi:MAG TPA: hypothetical protein VFA22_07470 [Stellaceae bacterium]|nr:hypothetical protein [Stellaceae bacterium]